MEQKLRPGQPSQFAFAHPAALFDEYKGLTAGRDLDYSGLSHALIDELGPQQWPFPAGSRQGTARLYTEGRFATADGRAHFVAEAPRPLSEPADSSYPLVLNTGRLRDQWHGMSRTGTAAQLFGHVERAQLSMHPQDMQARALEDGDLVSLSSRRGTLILPVQADAQLRPGQSFLPMHWGDRFLKGLGSNSLTLSNHDPLSKQPELKQAAVEVTRAELPWQLFVLVEGDVQQRFAQLRELAEAFDYLSMGLIGRERPAVLLRAAAVQAPDAALLRQLDAACGLDTPQALSLEDSARQVSKRIMLDGQRIVALRLGGETLARDWLRKLWQDGDDITDLRRWLLAPVATPPGVSAAANDKIICNCMNVSQSRICAGIEQGMQLEDLKRELGCGTQCGSCVPEIKQLLATAAVPA
ncbi:molybdopterin dinucleotide binding domain-containing protein [Halopseudomonas pachastrellae]|nr:molybdopterin dinucleotide binding domain-containing protein [Halopseudomonas pachastrellae]